MREYDGTTTDTNMEKYENNGKSIYFWFDDDNKMGYKYIFSIT